MAIKKYSKVKFTLRKELIIILAAIVVLVVATILLNLPNEEEKFLSKWQEAGSTMTENRLYEEVSIDNLKSTLDSKGADEYTFVFYATPSNTESVSYFDAIVSLASVYDIEQIYIVDCEFAIGGDRENDSEFDSKLAGIEANYKDANGNTVQLDTTPSFWVFKGNVLVDSLDNYKVAESADWNLALVQMFANAKA